MALYSQLVNIDWLS